MCTCFLAILFCRMSATLKRKRLVLAVGQFPDDDDLPKIIIQLDKSELVLQWSPRGEEDLGLGIIEQEFELVVCEIFREGEDRFVPHSWTSSVLIDVLLRWKPNEAQKLIPYELEIFGFFNSTGDDIIKILGKTLKASKKTRATFGMQTIVNFVNELDDMYPEVDMKKIPIILQDGWNTQRAELPAGSESLIDSPALREWDSATIDDPANNVSTFVKHRMQRQFKSDEALQKHYKTYMANMKQGGFYGFAGFRPVSEKPGQMYVENVGVIKDNIAEMSAAFADRCIVQSVA